MKVQILGTGCDKCRKLTENAKSAAAAAGLACTVEKIEDLDRILEMGAMITPALAIDGKIVSSGRVLSPEAIGEHLRRAAAGAPAAEKPASVPSEGGCPCGGACGGNANPDPAPAVPACSCGGACEPKPASEAKPEEACCGCGCGGHGGSSFAKTLTAVILLVFVIGSLAVMALRERGEARAASEAPAATAAAGVSADTVSVTYFHGSKRCKTCMDIEARTKAAVEAAFASEIADGRVLFRSVNIEEAANAHYVKDYGLTFSTVVVSRGDIHERLDNVWQLVRGAPDTFAKNITDAVRRVAAR